MFQALTRFVPLFQLILATVFWGGVFSTGKLLAPHLPPFTVTFARYGFAALVLLPLAWREFRAVRREDVPMLIMVGLFSSTLFNACLFVGLRFAPAGDAVLAPAASPLIVAIITALFMGVRHGRAKLAALALSALGVALLFFASAGDQGGGRLFGDAMILLTSAFWSCYLVLSGRFTGRYSPRLLSAVTALAGTLSSLPFAAWEGGFSKFATLPPSGWAVVAYLSMLGTVAAFLLWSRGVQQVGAARASLFMNLIPVWILLGAVGFLHERLLPLQWAGMAALLAGLFGANLAERYQRARAVPVVSPLAPAQPEKTRV
ncbi:EamA family transporter [bacterium]|nr:EamA family transporter [bacterium]